MSDNPYIALAEATHSDLIRPDDARAVIGRKPQSEWTEDEWLFMSACQQVALREQQLRAIAATS